MDSDNKDLTTTLALPVAPGFRQAAVEGEVDTSEQAGYALQKKAADKAREEQEEEKKKKTAGFFKHASAGDADGAGFSLAGRDATGAGFSLPLSSPSLLGDKWIFIHPYMHASDAATMHPPYARVLNRQFDRLIARAIKNNWDYIVLEQGVAGRVGAHPVLNNALNRRIAELAAGNADWAIEKMGYRPDAVQARLQTLKSHAGLHHELVETLEATAAGPQTPQPA